MKLLKETNEWRSDGEVAASPSCSSQGVAWPLGLARLPDLVDGRWVFRPVVILRSSKTRMVLYPKPAQRRRR